MATGATGLGCGKVSLLDARRVVQPTYLNVAAEDQAPLCILQGQPASGCGSARKCQVHNLHAFALP